jgi:AcrR family transcriptional regulator
VLASAETLFEEHGFATVTMEAIARHAGVSLATVYVHFPGKAAIVIAMAEAIAATPDLSVEHVEREPDPIAQIRIGAHIMRLLNERSWLVADVLRGARGSDAELAESWAVWQERHEAAIRRGIEAGGGLRAGLDVDEAVDVFYVLAGTEVYRSLVHERGWSPERYERWLFGLACRELLGMNPEAR